MDGCPSWSEMAKKHKVHAPGHRQREQGVEYAEAPFSHLARYLLEEFAFGGVSANQVQQLAWMAKRDGLQHTAVNFGIFGSKWQTPWQLPQGFESVHEQIFASTCAASN